MAQDMQPGKNCDTLDLSGAACEETGVTMNAAYHKVE